MSIKVVYLCISPLKHSLGAIFFPDFTVLRSLKSQNILQIRTNRTEKSKLHIIRPKKHRIQEKNYINFTSNLYIDFPFLVTKMIVRSHAGDSRFIVFTFCLNLSSTSRHIYINRHPL
jgi:hypothetical protein